MTATALLADFLSRDPTRIWSASGAVMHSWDRATLLDLAGRADDIRRATKGVDLGGALRANTTHLEFALRKLAFVQAAKGCFCGLYPMNDLFDPAREAKEGHVEILDEGFDVAAGTGHYRCRCTFCEAEWQVREETGYHYPWYVWTRP